MSNPGSNLVPYELRQIIENKVGDQDYLTLGATIMPLWNVRSDKDIVAPGLRAAYVLQDCIDVLLGQVWGQVDNTTETEKVALHQKTANLQTLRDNAAAEIGKIEGIAAGNRVAAIGQLGAIDGHDCLSRIDLIASLPRGSVGPWII